MLEKYDIIYENIEVENDLMTVGWGITVGNV